MDLTYPIAVSWDESTVPCRPRGKKWTKSAGNHFYLEDFSIVDSSPTFFSTTPIGESDTSVWQSFSMPVDTHLDSSRRLILAAADHVEPCEALAIGAGACCEIPVRDLADRFQSVTLHDMNEESLRRAIKNLELPPHLQDRVSTLIAELNGFDGEHLHTIVEGLEHFTEVNEAAAIVAGRLSQFVPRLLIVSRKQQLVVASCVLSQLHIPILRAILAEFQKFFPQGEEVLTSSPDWNRATFALSEQIERAFLEMLRANVTDAGRVYLSATIHLLNYRVTESGDWQSPGMMRACRFASLEEYTDGLFEIEQKEQWWWEGSTPCLSDQTGHGFRVEGAVLIPR